MLCLENYEWQPQDDPHPPPELVATGAGADDVPADAPTLANTDNSRTALS